MSPTKRVYIIGSVPADMVAAHVLNRQDFEVHVLERSNLNGGKVHSFEKDGASA